MEASGLPRAMAYLPLKKELQVYEWAPRLSGCTRK